MKALLVSFEHALRSVAHSLGAEPLAWLANAAIVAVAILLPLELQLALHATAPFTASLSADPEASVYFATDLRAPAAEKARAEIETRLAAQRQAMPQASLESRFVPRDEAWKQYAGGSSAPEAGAALAAIGTNPLPDSLVIRTANVAPDRLESLLRDLRAVPGVDAVELDLDWARRMAAWVDLLAAVRTGLAVLLGLVVVAVTFQATRSQVLGDRDEITIARLIGATTAFVRRPFVLRGLLLGLGGAALALGAAVLLAWRADPVLEAMRLGSVAPPPILGLWVALAAALLGAVGGDLCCRRYLS